MTPQKTILLKTVIEACHERTRDNTARACFPLFVEEFFRHASLTYLQRRAPEVLAEQALEAWNCLQKRPPKEQVFITMSTASDEGGYYLTIIQDEKVFLYDTVKLFLESREVRPSLFAHPVWCVVRTPKGLLQEIHHKQIPNGCWESLMFAYIKDSPNKALIDDLQQVLASVHTVVDGYAAMQGKLDSVIEYLMPSPEAQGTVTYLKWLQQDNFVFLGYRYFAVDNKTTTSALGLLAQEPYIQESKLMPSLTSTTPPLFNYVKTNYRSPVHCPSRINSLEIIHQKADGTIVGLHQFIGLYTRASFAHSVFSIPIIKEKVQEVFDNFNVLPKGYDGKLLARILESIPQDELLNASPHDIHEMAAAILQLKDGGLLALFVRPDPFSAFVSIIIYMPLERYSAATKERFAKLLPQVLGGEITSSKVLISDLPFARIIFVISYETPQKITYDLPLLEQELGQASLSWVDSFLQEINVQFTEAAAGAFARTYGEAFDTDYQEKFSVPEALFDLPYLEELTSENPINIRIYTSNLTQKIKVKIYHYAESLPLADMLPVLNNLELQPASETSFHVHPKDKQDLWIHDFDLKDQHDDWSPKIIHLIVDAFHHIWHGNSENDDLNRLVPLCSLNCSQVMILRGYLYYLRQIKFPYSFDYCQETLITYPHITREIINLFWIKFAPSDIAWQDRQQQRKIQEAKIIDLLQSVTSLDHDRILQRFLIMIQVTLRTNYFQGTPESHDFARTTSSFIGAHVCPDTLRSDSLEFASRKIMCNGYSAPKDSVAFKLDSDKIPNLPHPHPWVEVFIYSPRFQAIHLRGSKVSRGGIRWSDRPEDFRTEILGLMKAQTVKNAIIVPLGSKGGFVLKNPRAFSNRQQLQDEVVACYSLMMQNLLDLCDNRIDDAIVPHAQIIRYDGDDTYLVVAADKGTSTFSDIANNIAKDRHFWLDDAFASGGSTGYDHKEIGITTKGAWESIKRHFREMNHDAETQAFTVVGVGDMSGDIFGNLLRSHEHIQLLAAFNHQHIFLDPTPDQVVSIQERRRLFQLPYSTWADYQAHLLSKGGGIFSRDQKMIMLSPEVRAAFAITEKSLPPEKLIQKLLRAPVDLLWLGGIGTFIKASHESHLEAGDPTNDLLRVDAHTLKARIIGEGANLGMTQKARVEYALRGGRLNADFIDNSAGVDCSDHEVNIKILFHKLLREGTVTRSQRDALMKDTTEDVTQLILKDNYQQTQILSQLERLGADHWGRWQNLIHHLENTVKLDRDLESLPSDEDIERRVAHGQGPTRPELAILLSYSKNALYSELLSDPLCGNPFYESYLFAYFPTPLQEKFPQAIKEHPLRKEIIATALANILINRMGPLFILEQVAAHGIAAPAIVEAFFLIHGWLKMDDVWQAIESMDNKIAVTKQMQAFQSIQNILGNSITRFIRTGIKSKLPPEIHELLATVPLWMTDKQQQAYADSVALWQDFPKPLAEKLQQLSLIPDVLMIHHLANTANKPAEVQGPLYFQASEAFAFGNLQDVLSKVKCHTDWQESMLVHLSCDAVAIQAQLILSDDGLEQWQEKYATIIPRIQALQPDMDLAYFSFIINQLKEHLRVDVG